MKLHIVVAALGVLLVEGSSLHANKVEPCDLLDCRAGRECVVDDGIAQCLCIISCPEHLKPVCGSDGKSYDSHCLLHQHACVTGSHIKVEHKGYCKNRKLKNKSILKKKLKQKLANEIIFDIQEESKIQNLPEINTKKTMAACFSSQREAMRYLIIGYWRDNVEKQAWFKKGMTEREKLWGYFYNCDKSKDNDLTPLEIMDCAGKVEFYPRPGQNKMETKALCIEAIIEDADKDNDVKLDFNEFTRVMNVNYQPKDKYCSLSGRSYIDGQEVDKLCNHCVCAIGSWVCSPSNCDTKKQQNEIFQEDDFDNHIHKEFTNDPVMNMDISHHKGIADDFDFDVGTNTNFEEDINDDDFKFDTAIGTDFDEDTTGQISKVDLYDIDDKSLLKKNAKKYKYNIERALKKLKQLEKETKETEEMLMNSLKMEKDEKKYKMKNDVGGYTEKKRLYKNKKDYLKKSVKSKEGDTPWMDLLHFKNYDPIKFTREMDNDI